MKVRYNKGIGCPVEISDGKTATCISLDTAKKLQASLLAVIEQAEMPEEEMTEFEIAIHRRLNLMNGENLSATELLEETRGMAVELIALARDQFIKDGYVIEKKAFHNAVEKVAPEAMKDVSDKVDTEEALRLGYEKGKAEDLKDLPRWVRHGWNKYDYHFAMGPNGKDRVLVKGHYYILLSDLEKLPKED